MANNTTEEKKKMNWGQIFQRVGFGLSGLSAPFLKDWDWLQRQQQLQAQQQFRQWQMEEKEREQSEPTKMLKDFEANQKFQAWLKVQQGLPLTDSDKLALGMEDKTAKPNEWDLWKQAENEVKTQLGGSTWMGLSQEKTARYYPLIETRFLQLKKQFGLETPQDRSTRAKQTLREKGYVATDDTVNLFLKQNPNF